MISHHLLQGVLEPLEQVLILGASLILATLSYRYIEKPFRGASGIFGRPHRFYPIWGAVAAVTLLPAMHSWLTGGWLWRFPADLQAINSIDMQAQQDYVWQNFSVLSQRAEFTDRKPRVLVIGDSQAADLLNILVAAGVERKTEVIARVIADECGLPTLAEFEAGRADGSLAEVFVERPDFTESCSAQFAALVDSPLIAQAEFVIIAKFWDRYAAEGIEAFAVDLRRRTDARIEIAGGKGFRYGGVQMVNHLQGLEALEQYAATMIIPHIAKANEMLRAKFAGNFIDLISYICPQSDFCYVLTSENKPIFWDATHLTKEGAEFLAHNFADRIFAFLDTVE